VLFQDTITVVRVLKATRIEERRTALGLVIKNFAFGVCRIRFLDIKEFLSGERQRLCGSLFREKSPEGGRMDHPTVVVTGASRGLGAAAAHIAARLGASVVLAARSVDDVRGEAQKINTAGGRALALQGDIRREKDCREIIHQTLDQFSRIDALVNNAGIIEPIAPIAEANFQDWEENWAVNVLGPVMLMQLALPALRQQNGRIVNISSGAAVNVIGGWGAYSAAKAALNHLTKILAFEEPTITALSLRPGIVDTTMQSTIREKGKDRMAQKNYDWLKGQYEQGRLLPPEEPGKAIACLSLYAPHEWSGEILSWDEPRVQELVQVHIQTDSSGSAAC
jgi:NAD(P)-dependent dehydrogenase (short-subunit alcohol dehydrogenase family)